MFLFMMISPRFQIRNPGNSGQLTSGQCFVTTHWVVSSQPANQIMPAHGASCKTSTWSHYQWLHSPFRSHDWSQFSCLLHLNFHFLKCNSSLCSPVDCDPWPREPPPPLPGPDWSEAPSESEHLPESRQSRPAPHSSQSPECPESQWCDSQWPLSLSCASRALQEFLSVRAQSHHRQVVQVVIVSSYTGITVTQSSCNRIANSQA